MILASASPRRIELLNQFDIAFDVVPSHIDERVSEHESPEQIVMGLAFLKALNIAQKHPNCLVLASDTVVYLSGILGKPKDKNEAMAMLSQLSGKTHAVYSGVALLHLETGKKVVSFEKTKVTFNTLTQDTIEKYVNQENTLDKAGAYGIQGLGSLLVSGIEGDYYNVMGLPLSHLNKLLEAHFNFQLL